MKNLKKNWMNSLSFLDNCYINAIIVIILVLYSSTIFDNINSLIGSMYNYSIVKIIILLLIIYIAPKDMTIALLLAISYVVSLSYSASTENFIPLNTSNNQVDGNSFNMKYPMIGGESKANMPLPNNNNNSSNQFDIQYQMVGDSKANMPLPNNMNNSNNSNQFDIQYPMIGGEESKMKNENMNNTLSNEVCNENYYSHHEPVSNVCDPVATFKDELNAQGLNYPEGHSWNPVGSKL